MLRVTTFVHGKRDHCDTCYYVCPRVERPLFCVLLRLSTGRETIVMRVTTFVHGWRDRIGSSTGQCSSKYVKESK